MLNARYVRERLDEIRASFAKRGSEYPFEELLEIDEEYKKLQAQVQELRSKRNKGSMEVSQLRKEKKEPDNAKIMELAGIKDQIDELEKKALNYTGRMESILWNMPNVLDKEVPAGSDESGNVTLKTVGEPVRKKLPGHEESLLKLGLLDMEQAAKVSGARFYYLKGDAALLEQALIRFTIDTLVKKGYVLVAPPLMLKKEYYRGVTALSEFEDALYRAVEASEAEGLEEREKVDDELFLISTSEHAIAAMHAGKLFSAKELPKRYIGISPCFRREAGSHGKDTKGIFRVHQFYKVEQFIFAGADDSYKFFDELISNSEDIYKKLGIPYRVVDICTGDIGIVAARKNDIEGYMPGQDRYRELVSCSNCTDWQSLRLDIKYDDGGERKFVHTLNSTAIATTRTIVAIVENYANGDGTIEVPKALVKYMGKERIGKPKSQA